MPQITFPLAQQQTQQNFSIDQFVIGKKLGSGKFSEIYLAMEKQTGFKFAIKQIKKETVLEFKMERDIINEIKALAFLNHPGITKLYGYFYENDIFYIMQELACGQELYADMKLQQNKRYTEQQTANFIVQIIDILLYIHSKNIVHRDIKPENIMICSGILKLCDFGCSGIVQKDQMRQTFCGTLDYVSPEMVEGKEYDFSVDIWSLGVLTYELMFGKAPFTAQNHDAIFKKVVKSSLNFPGPISFEGAEFIQNILIKNPSQRINLMQAYQHPFIQNNLRAKNKNQKFDIDKKDLNILQIN
ncbi:protein kinase domain protein [Ichthyophthirius multifiliis]|uniref:Aurora kinase n=1 Tax=Ichthyophthirius multifiliis TaxID=5932 RepID=G0QV39_ICHMU|nr:protein kinase domain protein [Ichthyophthirius multifiliis]EGR30913.1 protein kinase domain protein [Ichthyophthirius multifiliis]|eukprot:XP_004032500.1 protein kinase domain protein [Ichthyophthirius multifiliis]